MSEDLQTRLEQALRERDEARADNAALLDAHRMTGLAYLPCIEETLDAAEAGSADMDDFDSARNALSAIDNLPISGPRPGAALLREVLALRRAREIIEDNSAQVAGPCWDEFKAACAAADAAREKT